ncbi:recombinase family protein [Agrobacterium tumefaciens]|uniref:recombinase family protein n=1 Tax=Agrobacterium tumefaciens TaxID=358 RepID=UPI00157171D9|nr:recombinase family protein [Agrobacterium tumefaciens]
MTTILYARVSTLEQDLSHQETHAREAGFEIDEVIADHGVSGVSTKLSERPEGRRLFDKLRKGDVLVVRWVDRLGRNYEDVTETIRQFMKMGVIIRTVINNMTFDGSTKDPIEMAVRDALIGFMAATAQAQAEATKAAQRAGIEAKKGNRELYRGKKPSFDRKAFSDVVDMLANDAGASAISEVTGLTRQTILRIKADPAAAETALQRWGM